MQLSGLVRSVRSLPPGGVVAVTCGVLLQLSLGNVYTIGNLTTYLVSYLRVVNGEDVDYGQAIWLSTVQSFCQGVFMLVGSVVYERFGARLPILAGSVLLSGCMALTFFAVKASFAWVVITYGALNGCGVGLAYTVPLLIVHKWFPNSKGLVTGIVVGGYGLGGVILTPIQTSFLNPNNVAPDADDGLFHDRTLLARVPSVFLLQAGVCAVLQVAGVLGLRDPRPGEVAPSQPDAHVDGASSLAAEERARGCEAEDASSPKSNSLAPLREKAGSGGHNSNTRNSSTASTARLWMNVLKTAQAWQLFCGFVLNTISSMVVSAYWKTFGQTSIQDDHFMELVGSGSAVFNLLGRVLWGVLCDWFGYKPVMVVMSGLLCAFVLTFQASLAAGPAMFLIWVCGIFLTFSGTYSIVVTGVANTFGQRLTGAVYGMISLAMSVLSLPAALLIELLLDRCGYSALFLASGLCTLAGMAATIAMRPGPTSVAEDGGDGRSGTHL